MLMPLANLRRPTATIRRHNTKPTPADHPLVVASKAIHTPAMMARLAKDAAPLPDTIDWRNLFPGPRDQGQEGACTGFATCEVRELGHGIATQTMIPFRLSPSYAYANARMAEGSFPSDNGATMADEFACLYSKGICPESDLPYDQDPTEAPTPICDAAAIAFRSGQPTMVQNDVTDMKTVLAAGMPIGIAIPVYESFENGGVNGLLPIPDTSREAMLGGHGLSLMGYTKTAWIGCNHWGTVWGDNGFFYMPFGYEQMFWEQWVVQPLA